MSNDMVRHGEFGKDLGLVHELLVTGRKVGARSAFYAALAHDEALFRRVVAMVSGQPDPVYDVAQVAALLDIRYSQKEIAAFGAPPNPLPGYLTFFDPGWSIVRIRTAVAGKDAFHAQDWYDCEPFANMQSRPGYRQIRMEADKGSFRRSFDEQREFPLFGEEVPLARAIVMGMVVHFLGSGTRLFQRCRVRCLDTDASGHRVGVGDFESLGFCLYGTSENTRATDLGIAICRGDEAMVGD
jgi:hypothetical protein